MRPSSAGRTTGVASDTRLYVLIASTRLAQHHRSDPPVKVFRSEGAAREAFRRLRLEVGTGSGWGELVAVDDEVVQPLCWFGRPPEHPMPSKGIPRRRARRWALGALALTMGALLWAFVATWERARAAVAPHVSRTSLVTVTAGQRAQATAVHASDGCHRMEIWLIESDGRTVASEASTVCRGQHLTVAHSPSTKLRLRSVVAMHSVPESISDACSHSLEVVDIETGRASVILSSHLGSRG